MRYCSRTDVGRLRRNNEDAVYADGTLFAVADGMGGHTGGEVASSMAIKILEEAISSGPGEGLDSLLREAILQAHQAIYREAYSSGLVGMGTTITAAIVSADTMTIGQVGDSRAYLLRQGSLSQLTQDDSLVAEMVREGQITKEQAFDHPSRHMLTQALGTGDSVSVAVNAFRLLPGDKVLLCSDGLTTMLEEGRIIEVLSSEPNVKKACSRLVEKANEAGGADNISVVILDFTDSDPFAQTKASKSAGKKGALRFVSLALIPLALFAALAAYGALHYLNNTYYLGFSKTGEVTIYRGIPGSFAGVSYSRIYRKVGMTRGDLWPSSRRAVEENAIVGSLDEVTAAVSRLELIAPPLDNTPQPDESVPPTHPLPPGHPSTEPTIPGPT